jgi:hypothetical protein
VRVEKEWAPDDLDVDPVLEMLGGVLNVPLAEQTVRSDDVRDRVDSHDDAFEGGVEGHELFKALRVGK